MAAQSYDRLEGVIWYDGKLVPWHEANLHVLSHGLHYASAVFEGERAYGGTIFKSTEHSERLKRSAKILDFDIPYSVAEIDAAKKLVVDKNGKKEAYVRPIAWRGSEMMGVSAQNNAIHLAIASWEWPSYFDPEQRLKGIRLDLADYRRPDPRTAPCRAKAAGLYMICTISKHAAERKGYADAMMLDWEGRVAECTGANIFFVQRRQDPHPDRRLLPRRPHPADRDRSRAQARLRGDRAPHIARRADRIFRVLHHRLGGGSDRGGGDRQLEFQSGRHYEDADGGLHRGSEAEGQSRGGLSLTPPSPARSGRSSVT